MTARSLVPEQVRRLRARYVKKREEALLDAAAATVALQAYVTDAAGGIDRFDPQMREAFTRALPSRDFESPVRELADSGISGAEHIGLMSTWKGTYFEILIRDELNAGNYVGDVYLLPGQQAVLADSSSQPAWYLRIVDADGVVVE